MFITRKMRGGKKPGIRSKRTAYTVAATPMTSIAAAVTAPIHPILL